MESEFAEEEVVENPTLKAAYNLAPLHQNQPLRWDYEVNLIGKKVSDRALHLCEVCELPVLVYGRLLPCKHIFCFNCARNCDTTCIRCSIKVQKVEELALGTVYVCTHGAPKHSTKGCRRTYLSQRDLQSHIAHRHMSKSSSDTKTSQSTQPQLPLTQQQATALHVSQAATLHSQPGLLSASSQQSQQVLSTAPLIPNLGGLASPKDSGHLLNPIVHDVGDRRTGSASASPIISQNSPNLKSNLMSHGMGFNPSPHSNEQGIYRPLDVPSLPHQLQHQLQHQQHHQLQSPKQQQQSSQMMQLSGTSGMPAMSKPLLRFNQPPQISLSSSLLPPQSHLNPYQVTASGSSEMQMSTQMHHQQSPNVHQQHLSGLMHSHTQNQLMVQKNLDQRHTDIDMGDFNNMQNRDDFGSMQKMDNLHSLQNIDNFNNMHQRKPFNNLQEMDNFKASYNSPQSRDNFNTVQGGMMDTSKSPLNPQGGLSRNKNVNLITVPIQDEGQYRPLPYNVNQSQFPSGAVNNNNNVPFSSSMSVSNNPPSNFSPLMNNQTMGGSGGIKSSPRLPFNRPGNPQAHMSQPGNPTMSNPQTRMSQPGNPAMSNPGLMMNNQRGGGGGLNIPPNVQGAFAGMVQAITRAKGGSSGGLGGMQNAMMPTPGSMNTPRNPRFNTPANSTHWNSGNLRSIRPRMTQNTPRPKGDSQFQQNYFG